MTMSRGRYLRALAVWGAFTCLLAGGSHAATAPAARPSPVLGRWDIRVMDPAGEYASWVEFTDHDGRIEGRFVGRVGGVRPLTIARVEGGRVWFELPAQFEPREGTLRFDGDVHSSWMKGLTRNDKGQQVTWTAQRAPALEAPAAPRWGAPVALLESGNLSAWRSRRAGGEICWEVHDGVLANMGPCPDLMTKRSFRDFRLKLEFRLGEGGDSGVHLRGRYEIQLRDPVTFNLMESASATGSLYSFIGVPNDMGRPAGEWQSLEATLLGRHLTVVLNGVTVIQDREIPGITGDALDADESRPGPIVLQGYLGPISFRNIVVTPAE